MRREDEVVTNPGLRVGGGKRMTISMVRPSPFEDPHVAQFAWARYRRVMRWMMLTTVTLVIGAMVALYRSNGTVLVHFYIVAAMGVGFAMLLMSGVLGLMFLSGRRTRGDVITHPPESTRGR